VTWNKAFEVDLPKEMIIAHCLGRIGLDALIGTTVAGVESYRVPALPLLRVLLVNEDPDRAASVREALVANGYKVLATLSAPMELYARVTLEKPDVIIIDTDSPSRDVIEHITFVSREQPRPIVMFSGDREGPTIRAAIRAGVTAYIVDGLSEARLQPILSVAVERFQAEQELKRELSNTKKQAKCDEETAFKHLRTFAMDHGIRMADAAERVIEMGESFS
jgi:two-component system, response regulator / RNA-binding antiterminator